MKIEKIYIDMDGVLVNFDGWKATVPGLTDENLWDHVKQIHHFYQTLEPMPLARFTMKYLESLDTPLAILTGIPWRSTVPDAEVDKRIWIHNHFLDWGLDPIEFNIGPFAKDKQNFAGPGKVLIDDSEMNVDQWNAKGGIGILYKDFMTFYDQMQRLVRGEVV